MSFRDKILLILKLTKRHAINLGSFAALYKLLMILERQASGKELSHHSAIAGLVGGYLMFGDGSPVSHQVLAHL